MNSIFYLLYNITKKDSIAVDFKLILQNIWEELFNRKTTEDAIRGVLSLQTSNYIKKTLLQKCFPVNIAKFLGTHFLKNICERLLPFFTSKHFLEFF